MGLDGIKQEVLLNLNQLHISQLTAPYAMDYNYEECANTTKKLAHGVLFTLNLGRLRYLVVWFMLHKGQLGVINISGRIWTLINRIDGEFDYPDC